MKGKGHYTFCKEIVNGRLWKTLWKVRKNFTLSTADKPLKMASRVDYIIEVWIKLSNF